MKVIDIFDKSEQLRELQEDLKSMVNHTTSDRHECIIDKAVSAIDEYIRELMIKEVKE